jgi:hypothetical protein
MPGTGDWPQILTSRTQNIGANIAAAVSDRLSFREANIQTLEMRVVRTALMKISSIRRIVWAHCPREILVPIFTAKDKVGLSGFAPSILGRVSA